MDYQKLRNSINLVPSTYEVAIFGGSFLIPESINGENLTKPSDLSVQSGEKLEVIRSLERFAEKENLGATSLPKMLFLADFEGVEKPGCKGEHPEGESTVLFTRMIGAMKLSPSGYEACYLPKKSSEASELEIKSYIDKLIVSSEPKFVLCFGARLTNLILGRKEKLSTVHGQFLPYESSGINVTLVPIFHPDYLNINPKMKKAAWVDLQKVLKDQNS